MTVRAARALVAAIAILGPVGAFAQEDPLETRVYRVDTLTKPFTDWPAFDFSIAPDSIGRTTAQADAARQALSDEELVLLIRGNIAPESWAKEGAKIGIDEGVLSVTNRKPVHELLGAYLARWRDFLSRRVVLQAALVLIEPDLLARIRPTASPALSPEQARRILDAAREGKQAELVKSMRATARHGQRVSLQGKTDQSYVRDVDIQVAGDQVAADPVVDVLTVGAVLDVRPTIELSGERVTMEVRAALADLEALEAKSVKATAAQEVKFQLPRIALDRIRTTLTARVGETVVAGLIARRNRSLALLLTPSVVQGGEKPLPEPALEEQRLLRLYDVGLLTRPLTSFPGPVIDFSFPAAEGAGAVFAAPDQPTGMSSAELVDEIRRRVAPHSWTSDRHSTTELGEILAVRQKEEVHRQIEAHLRALQAARARMVTSEAILRRTAGVAPALIHASASSVPPEGSPAPPALPGPSAAPPRA
jgi:hypothetical protein